MLVATLEVRNASIKRPVGTSKVRTTESRHVAISQRESGEKVCRMIEKSSQESYGIEYTISKILLPKPRSSLTILRVSMSTILTTWSSHITARRPLSLCSNIDAADEGRTRVCSSWVV